LWSTDLRTALDRVPLPLSELKARLHAEQPRVTQADVEATLDAWPVAHETDAGWVSMIALADGVVLTHVLTVDECSAGVVGGDYDLALWTRLAGDGLPLADGGGAVRAVATGRRGVLRDAMIELHGPSGWLDAFDAHTVVGFRLCGGALEVFAVDDLGGPDSDRMAPIVNTAIERICLATQMMFATRVGRVDIPGPSMDWLMAEIVAEHAPLLRAPSPPLPTLLALMGLTLLDGCVVLPGVPTDPDELAGLTDAQLWTRVRVASFLRAAGKPDEMHTELRDQFLEDIADPVIVTSAAEEAERVPLCEPAIEWLRAGASTRYQRAVVTLLTARSAEGRGCTEEAERLVAEALRQEPDLGPALMDAGEYAATRGDAARAEACFRRAGVSAYDPWRTALANLLAAVPSPVGRNRPCPCGSGRKHKVCCLRAQPHPLPARAQLVYTRLARWVQRSSNRWRMDRFYRLVDRDGPQSDLLPLDLALFEAGGVEEYLERRGSLLPVDERALIERWIERTIRPYEVVEVRRNRSVTLRPLLGGEPVLLRDRAFSTCVERLDLLVARILYDGVGDCLVALPRPVSRVRRRELMALFDDYSPDAMAAFFGPQPPPQMQNQDGHDLVFCTASYSVTRADAAWRRLSTRLLEDGPDSLTLRHEVDDGPVTAGSVTREGRVWTVSTNSVERMRELRDIVLAAAPGAKLISESAQAAADLVAKAGGKDGAVSSVPMRFDSFPLAAADDAEAEAAMAEFHRRYQQRWLDQSLAGLDDRTPRQAAAEGGAALAELNAILDDIEWRSTGLMDADWLRAELGLLPPTGVASAVATRAR
jgi:hypothetical protein